MRWLAGSAVLVAVVSLPFGAYVGWNWWYERENEQILTDIPLYPGARLADGPETTRIDFGWHQTYATHVLPEGTRELAVQGFYRRRLGGDWRAPDDFCRGYRRGDALVLISVAQQRVFLTADSRGADECRDRYGG